MTLKFRSGADGVHSSNKNEEQKKQDTIQLKSNGMNNDEYKLLIQQIKSDEERKYGIKLDVDGQSDEEYVDIVLDTFYEKFNSVNSTKKTVMFNLVKKSPYIYYYIFTSGFVYEGKANVRTGSDFLKQNRLNNTILFKNELAQRIFTTYHEIKHLLQYNYDNNEYSNWYNKISFLYASHYKNQYLIFHDNFYHEIEANLYGISKTEEYLKQFPKLYKENKTYIEKRKNKYSFDLNNFDFDKFFTQMVIDNKVVESRTETLGDFSFTRDVRFIDYVKYEILYKYVNSNNENEKKIVNSVLSNKEYIESLDMSIAKKEDLERITEAIQWKKEELENKILFNKEYLSKNKNNFFEQLKVKLANRKLDKKILQNQELNLYIQKLKNNQDITREFVEIPLKEHNDNIEWQGTNNEQLINNNGGMSR